MRYAALLLLFGMSVPACQTIHNASSAGSGGDVDSVADLLTGVFDSREQAASDPENYFEIRLVTAPIWPGRDDGRWLYVEQAAFSALDRPYRQRVYHIHQDGEGNLWSDVYTLPDPGSAVACWLDDEPLSGIGPAQLETREGCSILLERTETGAFEGGTIGEGCSSSIGGAAYATSSVMLTPGLLTSWDQGWNTDGEQVWGATKGGYRFIRQPGGLPADE